MTQPPPPGNYPPPPPAGSPGYPPPQQPQGPQPSSNLVWGILTTLFCCLPFGIVSIVKASQVNGLWAQGRFAEAQAASDAAKKWAIWAAVGAVAVWIIYAILFAVGAINMDFDTSSTY
ncbi:CD225/dispanin family protein [Mycolicibacterium austroafricanum]|uniref:CD225/dispanin family protein n=1 Tax=Mycolicibacterium austroafricanum TaxID=39687 RepID=UPI001CA332BB|nr:CD225/dispanin family protein [Mycolicibacterium austroafricanum]QZT61833.1 CD225/dispanin family protein [Mycolicibacterium austroafricanum]